MNSAKTLKGMEICSTLHHKKISCKECPYFDDTGCVDMMLRDGIAIINHQKAEFERLEAYTKGVINAFGASVKARADGLLIDEDALAEIVDEVGGKLSEVCRHLSPV